MLVSLLVRCLRGFLPRMFLAQITSQPQVVDGPDLADLAAPTFDHYRIEPRADGVDGLRNGDPLRELQVLARRADGDQVRIVDSGPEDQLVPCHRLPVVVMPQIGDVIDRLTG